MFRIFTNYQELFAPIFECLVKPSTMKKRCLPLPLMVLTTKCNEITNHNKLQVELLFKKSHDFFWSGGFFFHGSLHNSPTMFPYDANILKFSSPIIMDICPNI